MYVCMYVRMYVCMVCIYVCTYTYMYVRMYVVLLMVTFYYLIGSIFEDDIAEYGKFVCVRVTVYTFFQSNVDDPIFH